MNFSIHSILPLVAALLFGLLGSYVYLRRRGAPENSAYAFWCYTTVHWQLTFSIIYSIHDPRLEEWLVRFLYSGVIFIPIAFYHFIVAFVKSSSGYRRVKAAYLLGCIFATAIWTGQSVIQGTYQYFWGSYPRVGWLNAFYLMGLAYLVWDGLSLLIHEVKISPPESARRMQVQYVTWACAVYVLAALDFLPNCGIAFYPIGVIFTSISLGLVTYGITKHHLLDINAVIRKTLIYSAVTAALVSVYAGGVTFLARLLEIYSNPQTQPSLRDLAMEILSLGGRLTPFALSGLLAGITSFSLGMFVFFKSKDKKIARIWCTFSFSVSAWSFAIYWFGNAKNAREALWTARTGYAFGVIWIATLFYHFVCTFLGLERRKSILLNYFISLSFLLFVPTRLFYARAEFLWSSIYYPRSALLHYVFSIWWVGLVFYSHYLILEAQRIVSPVKRNQIKYFFLATVVGFTGGCTAYLPSFGIALYPWGYFSVFLYPIIMSYAILKHHLMDINIVIRKTLIYSLLSTALAAVYVGTITILAHVLEGRNGSATAVSSALAAVVITLLFNPIRVKIQRFVDRYFFREALDQALLREATSGFVHEIKRPLANISLPAELSLMELQDLMEKRRSLKEVGPKIRERLQYILDQTADAGNKIEAIQEFSHSNGKPPEDVDLTEIIRRSAAAEESLLRRHHIDLKLDIAKDLPTIKGHPKQLEIVIINLIKNAAEAMAQMNHGSERRIWLTATAAADAVTIHVKDSGPGIKPEARPHLFEPYFTTKSAHGTGMGLYLSKQIVQAHGGKIGVDSQDCCGTTFKLTLAYSNSMKI